jgi:hypothetical protein
VHDFLGFLLLDAASAECRQSADPMSLNPGGIEVNMPGPLFHIMR